MAVKMKAVRSFEGTEGFIRRGDIFEVETQERADELSRLELATTDGADGDVTNYAQRNAELEDMTKDELKATADAENIDYPDDILKEDLKQLIIRSREEDYINEQARLTAETNNNGTSPAETTTDGGENQ